MIYDPGPDIVDLQADEIRRLRGVLMDICHEAEKNPDHPSLTYAIAKDGLRKSFETREPSACGCTAPCTC